MQKIIKSIEKKNLSLLKLTKKMEEHFKTSHILRMKLIPMFEKAYCSVSDRNKELFEMGEFCVDSQYYYKVGDKFENFDELLKEDINNSDIQQLYIENSKNLYDMEKSKYLYKAYKRILTDKISMMDYNYNHVVSEWL